MFNLQTCWQLYWMHHDFDYYPFYISSCYHLLLSPICCYNNLFLFVIFFSVISMLSFIYSSCWELSILFTHLVFCIIFYFHIYSVWTSSSPSIIRHKKKFKDPKPSRELQGHSERCREIYQFERHPGICEELKYFQRHSETSGAL